jgi:hypothetical protein
LEDLVRWVDTHPVRQQGLRQCGRGTPTTRALPTRAHALRAVLDRFAKAHIERRGDAVMRVEERSGADAESG